ncbi:hypothetical protein AB0B40_32385 [Streptomyces sp. NPDC042638]|uniref:hypothetical protein n=1 Tax=Streptomyces sp. NPDC042638 TaxID=3154333 RepID=UPI0033C79488
MADVPGPLSALEHYSYCPRQCGLILLEDSFTNDAATVRGAVLAAVHHAEVVAWRLPFGGTEDRNVASSEMTSVCRLATRRCKAPG